MNALTPEEIHLILNNLSSPWREVFSLQWQTGCRISEAMNLTNECVTKEHVSFEPHLLPNGTWWKPKRPASVRKVRLHSQLRKPAGPEWTLVFFPNKKRPMSYECARLKLIEASRVIRRKVSSHDIRRARIVHALQAGADPHTVKRAVGHRSLAMTVQYLRDIALPTMLPPTTAQPVDNPVVAEWAQTLNPRDWK